MSSAKIPAKITTKTAKPVKPTKDTVYVDIDDEITGIIEKVDAAKQDIVAVVLPKRATMLQSIINMRLLKRSADSAGKNVVLITSEAAILPLAGAAGLYVAKNLQSKPMLPPSPEVGKKADLPEAESDATEDDLDDMEGQPTKLDYHRTIGELATAHNEDEAITLDDDEEVASDKNTGQATKQPKDKKLKVPNFERFRVMLILAIVGGILLIIFLILAIWVLPKSKIIVKTSSLPVSANFVLTTSDSAKTLDTANKVIPATLKTSDQISTQQVNATGQQNNGTKATGSITMSAQECGTPTPASDVPAGTGVSSNGLTYITQENTSFSVSQIKNGCIYFTAGPTSITSQSAGAKYNTSSGVGFGVAGRSDVSATGSASDGTDNIITIVAQSDLDKAKSAITTQTSDTFSKAFTAQADKDGYYVLASTLKLNDPVVTAVPAVGQQASKTAVTIKITYTVLAVKKADLSKAISDALSKQIDKTKQKLSTGDILKGATVTVKNQTSPTAATLEISESTTAVPILDIATVKELVGGQKTGAIKSSLSAIPGVKDVDVKMSPFWVSKSPKQPAKITVLLQQVKN